MSESNTILDDVHEPPWYDDLVKPSSGVTRETKDQPAPPRRKRNRNAEGHEHERARVEIAHGYHWSSQSNVSSSSCSDDEEDGASSFRGVSAAVVGRGVLGSG
jgi:hypothetical protein